MMVGQEDSPYFLLTSRYQSGMMHGVERRNTMPRLASKQVCYGIWRCEDGEIVDCIARECGAGAKSKIMAEVGRMQCEPDGRAYIVERETEEYESDGGLRDRDGIVVASWGGAESDFQVGMEM